MSQEPSESLQDLIPRQRGHFRLESGYHGGLWLELDTLFADPHRIDLPVEVLAERLNAYRVDAVCGALVGGAFLAQLLARTLQTTFCYAERLPSSSTAGLFEAGYRLPRGLAERMSGKRVAIVDDVMSAGSALRGTFAEVRAAGATVVVAAALLVLGNTGAAFFSDAGVPVETLAREDYELWMPSGCPLCAGGMPLDDRQ